MVQWRREEIAGHHWCLWLGTGAGMWREFLWRQEVIEQKLELIRHQKKSQVTVHDRSTNNMEMARALGRNIIWHSVTQSSTGCGVRCSTWPPASQLCPASHSRSGERVFCPVWGEMATIKFIQKKVIGYCPESLLSRIVQHYFAIPVLKWSMEMPGCEWNPFSAAAGQGSTILLSNFQMCQWGTSRAGIHIWLCSQRRLIFMFLLHGPADSSSVLHLEGSFPHSLHVWSFLFDLTNASLSGSW